MTECKCPYCNSIVNVEDAICSNCQKELTTQCPYCKQPIKVYDKVCPYCTTQLEKPDHSKMLLIIGGIFSTLWAISSTAVLTILNYFPQVFTMRDKDGDLYMIVSKYLEICLKFCLIASVPYIISLCLKSKVKYSVAALIVNVILAIIFIVTIIHLKLMYS